MRRAARRASPFARPGVQNGGMDLSLAVIAFLAFAVLLALGILLAVALPQLRAPLDDEHTEEKADQRHTSRTGR